MENIRINVPFIDNDEIEEVKKVLDSGYLTQGPKVQEFESFIKDYTGCEYAFATSSATTALHLSLVALAIKPGDEVLIADFTYPATANVVVQQGAIPVPVDIDLNTFCIDIEDLELKITPRTKAIIPVDAFGLSCDIDAVMELAKKYELPVIQDSACSLGSTFKDKKIGSIANTTCFSFHPRKSITTGEGGMLTTNDSEIAERVSVLRTHGGIRKEFYQEFVEAGFNYRMSDVQAAIGIAQSRKLKFLLDERQELALQLKLLLDDNKLVTTPTIPENRTHTFQSFVVMLDKSLERDDVIRNLRQESIESTLGTYSVHCQPYFQKTYGWQAGFCKNSKEAFDRSLTLPLWAGMDNSHLTRITKALEIATRN